MAANSMFAVCFSLAKILNYLVNANSFRYNFMIISEHA